MTRVTEGQQRPALNRALDRARNYLISLQESDGHWCGELEGDTILESEYVLCMHFLGRSGEVRVRKAANAIRRKQTPAGGWAIYPGGPTEVSASVKAYLVLKMLGDAPSDPHMTRAREAILRAGGVEATNSFTKMFLSVFGEYRWSRCPAIPPEMILIPGWCYLNIYEMSSWSRAIVIPLSIIRVTRPHCELPEHARIPELFSDTYTAPQRGAWARLFLAIDQGIKLLGKVPFKPYRLLALERCERWILDRIERSDGLGAIFPGIINTLIALRSLGYSMDHPVILQQMRELEKLELDRGDEVTVQPCLGPVWDTALAVNALIESGMSAGDPALQRAARWAMDKRGNELGDWSVKVSKPPRPGWYFEYANPYYPDNDTTAKMITTLSKIRFDDKHEDDQRTQAMRDAHQWHLSMQNRGGGWAAFDKDCDKEILTHVPFADHNAMIDPSTADITARVLESMARLGYRNDYPPARRAIRYLLNTQADDGSWYGRWGCNFIYGTWLALWGLNCIGESMTQPWARRATAWLGGCQNSDGGWGESPGSYDDPAQKGQGSSSASQTAWALMGLMAGGESDSDRVRRGVDYLTRMQRDDGSWFEEQWTGTGFPKVFYLRYHLYGIYFPLLALSQYRRNTQAPR